MVVLNNKTIITQFTIAELQNSYAETLSALYEENPGYNHHYIILGPDDQRRAWCTLVMSHTPLRLVSLYYEIGYEKNAIAFFDSMNPQLKYSMFENTTHGDPRRLDARTVFRLRVEDIAALN